jgi:GT2 family glycosyltransferase
MDEAGSVPEVSVVIVTWNGRPYLDTCLGALAAQRNVRLEIILVDNGSTDGTVDYVRSAFPSVRVLALDRNRGFAGGNNAGAAIARGRHVMFLNNDTAADPDCVQRLRAGLDEAARVALTTAQVVFMHDPTIVDSAGDGLLWVGGAFKHHHGQPAADAGASREVFGVCGAACLMPRAVFEELGGFDEAFFFSHEDVDLSYRARLRGYRCRYVAEAKVLHQGSGTSGRASTLAVFHGQRNLEWLYVKNTPLALLVRTLPGHTLYTLAAAVHFARAGQLGTFVRAKGAALVGLPDVLRKRAAVQAGRRVGGSALVPLMDRGWISTKVREKRFSKRLNQA